MNLMYRFYVITIISFISFGCTIDASIFGNKQANKLLPVNVLPPSFNISAVPKEVPENFPYLADLSLDNSTGSVVYSFDSNTCTDLSINSSTGELKGVLGHNQSETCTYSVKATIDGTTEITSDPVTLTFTAPLNISFSTYTESVRIGDPAKTVQLEFSPAPPYDSYLPYELISFSNTTSHTLDGFTDKGEIQIESGIASQDISLRASSSTSLPHAEYQNLYLTAGSSISRPQIDLAIYEQEPSSIIALESNSVGSICAITVNGTLQCWGDSAIGEMGTGNASESFIRPEQIGTKTTWEKLSMSGQTTCGIAGGELFCWGHNDSGQVGTGSTSSYVLIQHQIDTSTSWTYISTGSTTCGIKSGELYCWGNNSNGKVGAGSTGGNILPITKIGSFTNWEMVSIGNLHTCGIAGGNLYCWGSNSVGQVGTGAAASSYSTPQLINSGSWTDVTAGNNNTCGVKAGALYCWGHNMWGQSMHSSSIPLQIGTDVTWTKVHNTYTVTCGVNNESLYCWGMGSGFPLGQMGLVDAGPGWTSFKTSSFNKACGIKNGQPLCFPDFSSFGKGYLGNGNASGALTTPLKLGSGSWDSISRGSRYACGIQNGELYCWGSNNQKGQLANGTLDLIENFPRKVGFYNDWTHVAVESDYSAGIRNGELYTWGYSVGPITNVTTPTRVGTANNWTDVSAASQVCGIESGKLYCWTPGATPTQVGTSSSWTHISVGTSHRCGINAGELFCWGSNDSGQLGLGATSGFVASPTKVGSGTDWTYVSASRQPGTSGSENTCGIKGGLLYCWGSNDSGQNGNNTTTGSVTSPTLIAGMGIGWTKVTNSKGSTCGIQNGKLFCWGNNMSGQIGAGGDTELNQLTPVQVGTDSDWTDISMITQGVLGIRNNTLYGWGDGAQFLSTKGKPVTTLDIK